jgi:hypothetical protein
MIRLAVLTTRESDPGERHNRANPARHVNYKRNVPKLRESRAADYLASRTQASLPWRRSRTSVASEIGGSLQFPF